MNASALALGGMAKGISPLEMASAYQTFQNRGTHIDYTAYSKIEDVNGDTILRSNAKKTKVIDASVAFIMSDILHTTVTNGIASAAQVSGQVTCGKTGTTTDNYDAWFCGFTPQYSAALWIGNDVNIELSEGSSAAARLWSQIMTSATKGMSGDLETQPSTVTQSGGEYYAAGTDSGLAGGRSSYDTEKKKDTTTNDNKNDTNNNNNNNNNDDTNNDGGTGGDTGGDTGGGTGGDTGGGGATTQNFILPDKVREAGEQL
jgi:penicillin-binding protein 1A